MFEKQQQSLVKLSHIHYNTNILVNVRITENIIINQDDIDYCSLSIKRKKNGNHTNIGSGGCRSRRRIRGGRGMICKIYRLNELQQYKYVVVLSIYKGKIMLSRHKERTTWETQGGHVEPGETPLEAARRELYEESGAVEFEIKPVCDYWAGPEEGVGSGGMVFAAEIHRIEAMPESEMSEIGFFDRLPDHLTYPDITPVLYAQIGRCVRIGGYYYKRAAVEDLELLVAGRLEVLKAANKLADDAEMPEVEGETRKYYSESFQKDCNVTYLAYDGHRWIAAGSISFYQVMPTYHNPSGKKAYIMNMYTHPDYRRRGIAMEMLELLVAEAKKRGISRISLEATEAGKPLYEKYGFTRMKDEMELL